MAKAGAAATKVKKKTAKPKLSPAELEAARVKADHAKILRAIFVKSSFNRIKDLSDLEFTFDGQMSDFDDIFVYENILVCVERTATSAQNISGHLKPKKIVYDKIQANPVGFVSFYCSLSKELTAALSSYQPSEVVIRIVYASRYNVDDLYKSNVPNPVYMDYPVLRYFKSTVDCIHSSARYELLEFLGISADEVGANGAVGHGQSSQTYIGSVLPEVSSNFAPGYKVVSFYIDPQALLERAYVLRRDGWRESHSLYQRMLSKAKVDSIRRYLKRDKRVFVNNIIATLPSDTKIVDGQGNTVDPAGINKTKQVKIQVPIRHSSIGLVDGQHRTFSYYESDGDDAEIASLRKKQNLLLTGVIYPPNVTEIERQKFEARLFLEINSNQTTAKSNLKQAIGLVLEPFSPDSIAARVLDALDRSSGPLSSQIERYFYDVDKLKPTSIISYALKPLVKPSGLDSLFALWTDTRKGKMVAEQDAAALEDYIKYCVVQINATLVGFKVNSGAGRWTTDKSVAGRLLTTTFVNAFLITLRISILRGLTQDQAGYIQKLSGFSSFDASVYHSSQYKRMAEEIVGKYLV